MGFSIASRAFRVTLALSTLLLAGCGTADPRPSADDWELPKKGQVDSAMIIGRIGMPPGDEDLRLFGVVFTKEGGGYICGGMPCGEEAFAMPNNYFVVPSLKPGVKYYFQGFSTARAWHSLPVDYDKPIVLKPGQILFVGSHDYVKGKSGFFGPGSFSLQASNKPSELEILQWLHGRSSGSGWEPVIGNRIKVLGGKVGAAQQPAVPTAKK
jgi:hypothetical protein